MDDEHFAALITADTIAEAVRVCVFRRPNDVTGCVFYRPSKNFVCSRLLRRNSANVTSTANCRTSAICCPAQ